MAERLLSSGSAFELYYRLIAAAENVPFSQLKEEEFSVIHKRWKSRPKSAKLSEQIGVEDDDTHKRYGEPIKPDFTYYFGLHLSTGRPIVLDDVQLKRIKTFLVKSGQLKKEKDLDLVMHALTVWSITDRHVELEGSRWFLYHFRDYPVTVGSGPKIQGVIRSVLIFKEFGKAELHNYNPKEKREEKYFGSYDFTSDTIILQMKMRGDSLRNLRIFISIGTIEGPTLGMGCYHNIDEKKIYAGTVMMDSKGAIRRGTLKPIFLNCADKKQRSQAPAYVWKYFEKKEKNFISAPRGVSSEGSLINWWSDNHK